MTRSTHPFEPEEVMAYLDGELSPQLAAAAAAHLEQCAECRVLAAELRGVSKHLLAWQIEPSSESLEQGVLAAAQVVSEKSEAGKSAPALSLKPSRRGFRLVMYGLTASVALLLLFAISTPNLLRSRIAPKQARTYTDLNTLSRDEEMSAGRGMTGKVAAAPSAPNNGLPAEEVTGPMIVRTAALEVVVKEFDAGRAALDNLLRAHHGYAGQLTVTTPQNAGRTLTATLEIPASELDAVMAELKKLGRVEQESQAAEEVTRQYVDLTARLKNARETEQRLIEVLRERTGKVKDVLEVEQEIARVRGEIEQMDAQRKNLEKQVRYSALQLKLSEEYKAAFEPPQPSAGTRLGNALVEGFRDAIESGIAFLVFLLNVGPWLVMWALLLFWPARLAWRRVRAFAAR